MNNIIKIFVAATLTFFTTQLLAQDTNQDAHDVVINIPEVALLDIESEGGNNTVTLGPSAPEEAGEALDFSNATDNSLWINYSSVIGSTTEASRNVTVAITGGDVPAGMELDVVAAAANGGKGTLGTPAGSLTLNGTAQDLITAIGSAYTENGANKGHQLTYTLRMKDTSSDEVANLDFDDANTLTITYTLTDN